MSILTKWATGRNIVLLLLVFLMFNLVVIPALYPKFQTLDTLSSYTPAEAYRLLGSYGEAGRQSYLVTEVTLDMVYPLATAILFSVLILYSFKHGFPDHAWLSRLALIPFAVLIADYFENACVVIMLRLYPRQLPFVALASNTATILKLAFTPLELIFLIGLAAWLVRAIGQSSIAGHRA